MVKAGVSIFNKYQKVLMHIMSKLEVRTEPYRSLYEIFDGGNELALAIFIQNCLHPKNAQRVEAIKNGSYVEIDSQVTARKYLKDLLKKHLEVELRSAD